MTTPFELATPTWVRKRDGRTVPFEADRISRALFAAGESCGRPDAFLARELADAVVHFLTDESDGKVPTTEQVREVVGKVLRGLKQHDLVQAFEEHARRNAGTHDEHRNGEKESVEGVFCYSLQESVLAVRAGCTRDYTLRVVYTRDLASAHHDGLVTLGGLEAPGELASCLLGPPGSAGGTRDSEAWPGLLEGVADSPGRCVVLEGPEYALLRLSGQRPRRGAHAWAERVADGFLRELSLGLRLAGRRAVLNVNSAAPPPWADEAAAGPLFASEIKPADPGWVTELTDALLEAGLEPESAHPHVRLDWHLSERDFLEPARERLTRIARAALVGAPLRFVFDRSRRPLFLAEGVQRRHPAVLLSVGVHLPRLAALVSEESHGDGPSRLAERLLERLKSLARLALSAGLQKREFLRRHAPTRGFLPERARLLVSPVGLDAAVQTLLGRGLCSDEEALELGRAILRRLREVLREEGRASALETCVDAPADDPATHPHAPAPLSGASAAGPTGWDAAAPVTTQLRATGELHAATEGGTAVVFLPAELPTPEEVADWLHGAWKETDVVRVRLAQAISPAHQLTFPVAENR
jgi:hypothetical protein